MHTITNTFTILWEALFLQAPAYISMRDDKKSVTRGLVLLIILGVAFAIAGFIGTTLDWASSPSLEAIQNTNTCANIKICLGGSLSRRSRSR